MLLTLLGLAGYVPIVAGAVHLRACPFRDSMAQQLRFTGNTSDAEIVSRLRARADSLGLPQAAPGIGVQPSRGGVPVWSEYIDTVALHLVQREVRFSPHVERAW